MNGSIIHDLRMGNTIIKYMTFYLIFKYSHKAHRGDS